MREGEEGRLRKGGKEGGREEGRTGIERHNHVRLQVYTTC